MSRGYFFYVCIIIDKNLIFLLIWFFLVKGNEDILLLIGNVFFLSCRVLNMYIYNFKLFLIVLYFISLKFFMKSNIENI